MTGGKGAKKKDTAMENFMKSGPPSAIDKEKTKLTATNSSSKTQNEEIKESIQGVASDVKLLIDKQKEDHTEVTKKLNDIITDNSDKREKMSQRITRFEKFHGISQLKSKKIQPTLTSPQQTPEIKKIASSAHCYDFSLYMKEVQKEIWDRNRHSYALSISNAFGGMGQVIDVTQFPTKTVKGKLQFPVTIEFSSPWIRNHNVSMFERRNPNCQNITYALGDFPQVQQDLKAVKKILMECKREGLIDSFKVENFIAIETSEYVAPLYKFRCHGS